MRSVMGRGPLAQPPQAQKRSASFHGPFSTLRVRDRSRTPPGPLHASAPVGAGRAKRDQTPQLKGLSSTLRAKSARISAVSLGLASLREGASGRRALGGRLLARTAMRPGSAAAAPDGAQNREKRPMEGIPLAPRHVHSNSGEHLSHGPEKAGNQGVSERISNRRDPSACQARVPALLRSAPALRVTRSLPPKPGSHDPARINFSQDER